MDEINSSHSAKHRAPKSSLGKVPKLQPTTRGSYSFDSATEILGGLTANSSQSSSSSSSGNGERDVEKARLQLKSLSLQNGMFNNVSLLLLHIDSVAICNVSNVTQVSWWDSFVFLSRTKLPNQSYSQPQTSATLRSTIFPKRIII